MIGHNPSIYVETHVTLQPQKFPILLGREILRTHHYDPCSGMLSDLQNVVETLNPINSVDLLVTSHPLDQIVG